MPTYLIILLFLVFYTAAVIYFSRPKQTRIPIETRCPHGNEWDECWNPNCR